MCTRVYVEIEDTYSAHNYKPLDVVLNKGEGVWVWDVEGNKYLDCLAAYSALNHGHRHPRIINALLEQAKQLTLTSRAFRNNQAPLLAKELCLLSQSEMSLFMNSGAEAVETAIKAARLWGHKVKQIPPNSAEIIVCDNNFHGRTISIISFSTEPLYREHFGPFTPGFKRVPFGSASALDKAVTENTAAFLVEPIQGEAGVVIPPDGYLTECKKICGRHNILFILDEVQTGFGRTGKLFAGDWEAVKPNLRILGKALSGGIMPVSAVVGDTACLGLFEPGMHGSTYGGNPLGCAVAREALRVTSEENLPQHSLEMGEYFMRGLKSIPSKNIKEVRGKGLMIGVELKTPTARSCAEKMMNIGILAKDTHNSILRFTPPLVITKDEINWALDRIASVLT